MRIKPLVLAGALALAGCGGGDEPAEEAGSPATAEPSATVEPPDDADTSMPAGAARICGDLELLAPACPTSVPESRYGAAGPPIGLDGPYADGGYALCLRRREGACVSEAFHLEGGVPTGDPARDRPPRFVHVSLHAARGSLGTQLPWLPCAETLGGKDDEALLTERRRGAVCLGEDIVGERRGVLVLAPPYPMGGEAGGHVAFLWSDDGVSYAATLHAWVPLEETRDALRRLVASSGG